VLRDFVLLLLDFVQFLPPVDVYAALRHSQHSLPINVKGGNSHFVRIYRALFVAHFNSD
jgi:hypothetical protein